MKRMLFSLGALIFTFAAGVAIGKQSVGYASEINTGLVNAMNSVGQNLFGSSAFGASYYPPDPVFPVGAVQLDVVSRVGIPPVDDDLPFPKMINVVVGYPPDPIQPECMIGMQITLGADGTIAGIYDPNVQDLHPELLNFTLEPGTPGGTAFCGMPPPTDDSPSN